MPDNRIRRVRNGDVRYLFTGAKRDRPLEKECGLQQPVFVRLDIDTCKIPYGKRRKPVFRKRSINELDDLFGGGPPVATDPNHEAARPKPEAPAPGEGQKFRNPYSKSGRNMLGTHVARSLTPLPYPGLTENPESMIDRKLL